MNGITILHQETVPSSLGSLQIILMVTGILLAVISLIMFILSKHSRHDDALKNASLATILISLVLIDATGAALCIPSLYEQKTQYYVTISDEVSYKEFIEKYEVIECKGDIYIVEEKPIIGGGQMIIINPGKTRKGEFYFKCRDCGCEWYADRGEVKISPPCVEFYTYMKCPNCGTVCCDR